MTGPAAGEALRFCTRRGGPQTCAEFAFERKFERFAESQVATAYSAVRSQMFDLPRRHSDGTRDFSL